MRPYEDIASDVRDHAEESDANSVWMDRTRSNFGLSRAVPESKLVDAQNAVVPMKACKNEAEMRGDAIRSRGGRGRRGQIDLVAGTDRNGKGGREGRRGTEEEEEG